ncbi:hypothetical protein [Roseivirga pacifica]|uniref:hypothetical protein n=1 Tax=Roseivirga pacifica TaxID=1267423 RepID=UPI0020941017|nr:hypothetical protein [Roseivirga pacifica]MCO6359396.1 hypothetical protein [Roseivirga pacifica]MCO6366766.1 hypothetical protein [Roseivirga pacifica]MCO6370702.1 hypothetical protein [Roseivirga pacifica]MCO6374422.1 hypothetical protein [Roseivirga pacifica]MCO6379681.1 hypothetical protein [Roseivirga pacifica]
MKKLKNGLLAITLLTGTVFMFNANESNGQILVDPDGNQYVCCQKQSNGCKDLLGNYHPEDEKKFAETCS